VKQHTAVLIVPFTGKFEAIEQLKSGSLAGIEGRWSYNGIVDVRLHRGRDFVLHVGRNQLNIVDDIRCCITRHLSKCPDGIWIYTGGDFMVKIADYDSPITVYCNNRLSSNGLSSRVNPDELVDRLIYGSITYHYAGKTSLFKMLLEWSEKERLNFTVTVDENTPTSAPKRARHRYSNLRYLEGDELPKITWYDRVSWKMDKYVPPVVKLPGEILTPITDSLAKLQKLNTNGLDAMSAAMDKIIARQIHN
jgi:hypothetical protein